MLTKAQKEYLVGIEYFAGWWRELPNKYVINGRDWRRDYPERISLCGEYNEQETMDREILEAAKYGVDYFQILWYPKTLKGDIHDKYLNVAVGQFMQSPNSGQMRFTIEYVNHPPFEIRTDENWEAACREWIAAMQHPSYLRIGGRPVFKIHAGYGFLAETENDPAKAKTRLETFRRISREAGIPEPLIGAGAAPLESAYLYDFLATYMDLPNPPVKETPYPYEDLLKYAENNWMQYAKNDYIYVPYLPAGFDARPWKDARPAFAMPTHSQWVYALKHIKNALDKHPKLGIMTARGRQKTFTIYAWNEFGEGGIVAPTKGEGAMKLEAIREVFGEP